MRFRCMLRGGRINFLSPFDRVMARTSGASHSVAIDSGSHVVILLLLVVLNCLVGANFGGTECD